MKGVGDTVEAGLTSYAWQSDTNTLGTSLLYQLPRDNAAHTPYVVDLSYVHCPYGPHFNWHFSCYRRIQRYPVAQLFPWAY